jgi:formate-dependent nitrite reductase cytochrome c552 subunit
VISQSKLEKDPRLKTMWAGYAFSVDFREERGHAYMLDDQTFTKRQAVKPDYDVNKQATQKEMRAFVCGQCHVEYYFKDTDKELTYPWAKGLKVDAIQEYYDEARFKDWIHKLTGAPVLKAQHPEFDPAQLDTARHMHVARAVLPGPKAENSTGFHAPHEALRIVGDSINYARQGQLVLRDPAFRPDVKVVIIPADQPGPNQATGAPPAGAAPAR